MLENAFGQFLGFCERTGRLDPFATATGHIQKELIDDFIDELRVRVSSVTRASWLQRVHHMARLLAPERDFSWLQDIVSQLKDEERPRPKAHRIVDTTRIVRAGINLMESAEKGGGTNLQRALLFRDGLMIALLGLCPIRLKNFAGLTIGRHIRRDDTGWWIFLDRNETKTKRSDVRPVRARLDQSPGSLGVPLADVLPRSRQCALALHQGWDDGLHFCRNHSFRHYSARARCRH
jgi:hypothetical protein